MIRKIVRNCWVRGAILLALYPFSWLLTLFFGYLCHLLGASALLGVEAIITFALLGGTLLVLWDNWLASGKFLPIKLLSFLRGCFLLVCIPFVDFLLRHRLGSELYPYIGRYGYIVGVILELTLARSWYRLYFLKISSKSK